MRGYQGKALTPPEHSRKGNGRGPECTETGVGQVLEWAGHRKEGTAIWGA